MTPLAKRVLIGSAAVLAVVLAVHVADSQKSTEPRGGSVLREVAQVPLPGAAVRFDYQSLDPTHGRLYISHMNADQLVVFDIATRQVVANLDGFKRVHGVIAAPEANRVFASATGDHRMVAVDMASLKIVGSAGPIDYPDGLAYAPSAQRVFVSDEHGGMEGVVDARTNKLITSIPLGGGAGNTVFDPASGQVLVAVHGLNELAVIDPGSAKIVGRYKLPGLENPHGIALDSADRLAFVAGEENHSLAVFDLKTMKVSSVHQVGRDPDVLAFDSGLGRLYVSAESGTVTVLQKTGRDLRPLGEFHMPHAHTVSVDSRSHLVYFPLENISGHPVLEIMQPADQ